jgi:hypothetical protein
MACPAISEGGKAKKMSAAPIFLLQSATFPLDCFRWKFTSSGG